MSDTRDVGVGDVLWGRIGRIRVSVPEFQIDIIGKEEAVSILEVEKFIEFNGYVYRGIGRSRFIPYGGDQDWYANEHIFSGIENWDRNRGERMATTGCGAIAATNVIYYYAQNFTPAFSKFRMTRGTFIDMHVIPTQGEYITVASDVYDTYTPQTLNVPYSLIRAFVESLTLRRVELPETPGLGIWFIDTVCDGIVTFARARGVRLRKHTILNNLPTISFRTAADFITEGLVNNFPVILLVTFNDYIASLPRRNNMAELHFVVITSIKKKTKIERRTYSTGRTAERILEEDYDLVISNWGARQTIPSLKEMWEGTPLWFDQLQSGLVISQFTRRLASISLGYCSFK